MKDKEELKEKIENYLQWFIDNKTSSDTNGVTELLDLIHSEVEKAVAEEREVVMVTVEETLSRLSLLTDEEMGDFFVELYSSLDQLRKDTDE